MIMKDSLLNVGRVLWDIFGQFQTLIKENNPNLGREYILKFGCQTEKQTKIDMHHKI